MRRRMPRLRRDRLPYLNLLTPSTRPTESSAQRIDRGRGRHFDAPRQFFVQRDERVGLQLGERDVLGVVRRGPSRSSSATSQARRRSTPSPRSLMGIFPMRARRSRATEAGMSPRWTASCRADRTWERRSVGARSSCSRESSISAATRCRTALASTTNLVIGYQADGIVEVSRSLPYSPIPAGSWQVCRTRHSLHR